MPVSWGWGLGTSQASAQPGVGHTHMVTHGNRMMPSLVTELPRMLWKPVLSAVLTLNF